MSRLAQNVVIVGGGPVGLAFALAAAGLPGVNVSVIEKQSLPGEVAHANEAAFDHRVYALSPASMTFLRNLGVGPHLLETRLMPIRAMHVFGDAATAESATLPELTLSHPAPLATMIEHRHLLSALVAACRQIDPERLRLIADTRIESVAREGRGIAVQLAGEVLRADLLIGADGRRSQVRNWFGLDVIERDDDSAALVANFQCERDHLGGAYQWFSGQGVLAYLPLPAKQMSIVWSGPRTHAEHLRGMDEQAFCATVGAAGHGVLGSLALCSPRDVVPLVRSRAQSWVAENVALMGDAAHAIHPLAGQGANLGFADAEGLARLLRARSALSGVGDLMGLREYERSRIGPTLAMSQVTERLRALYLDDASWAKMLRQTGLSTFDRLPALKAAMIDYAVG